MRSDLGFLRSVRSALTASGPRASLLRGSALVGGLALSSTAFGYRLIGWDWDWQSAPMSTNFFYNSASFPASVGTQAVVTDAIVGGMNRWGNDGGADFRFKIGGATTQTSFTADGVFIAQYSNTTASGGTLAVAQSFGNNGRMTECDIRFYAANQYGPTPWRAAAAGVSSSYVDLEQVVTHEFGHCTGLDHSSSSSAVMFASYRSGSVANRQLSSDDKAGLVAMYGAAASPTSDLVFDMRAPLYAGLTSQIVVTGANAGETVLLYGSAQGVGSGPCPSNLGGTCLGVKSTALLLAQKAANSLGTATFRVTPPANFAGTVVGLQAAVARGANSVVSNTDSFEIRAQGVTCPSGWTQDCAATCVPASYQGDGYCDDGTVNYNDPNTGFSGYTNLDCSLFNYDESDCN